MGEPSSRVNETSTDANALRTTEVSTNDDPTFVWDKSYNYDSAGNIATIAATLSP
jgi:hypothetical protein